MPNMKLQSSDGEIFEVDVEVAKCFVVIKEMLEGLGMEDNEEPIPLPNVTSPILQKVIEWATHHQNNSLEPAEYENNSEYELENRSKVVSLWDIEFLQVDQGTLFELILAANYLNIKSLLDAGCKTIANMIKGKRPEEIRQTFNIRNDFTSEEIENLDRDHRWREDD